MVISTPTFKRLFIHIGLILLFAFAQIGAATHSISHVNETKQSTQHDKKTAHTPCAQCIAYAQTADGATSTPLYLSAHFAQFALATFVLSHFYHFHRQSYQARAPPASLN
jgi:hypothetical protein